MTARVAGYLLLEIHAQSNIFGDAPYASLVTSITSPSQSDGDNEHDVVYMSENCAVTSLSICVRFITFLPVSALPVSRSQVRKPITPYPASYKPGCFPSSPSYDRLEGMIEDFLEATDSDYMTLRRKVRIFCTTLHLCCR